MTGFEADVQSLQKAVKATRDAADQGGSVTLKSSISHVNEGMDSSASADVARKLGERWEKNLADWKRLMLDYANALDESAKSYQDTDLAAKRDLSRQGGR
ncbi:hypothetical protein [Austwickia sp. TVS 96-490-7B]|uniref:hypothetical protein n=1 Tax=Austwickia sp. TVS 96-490-7B TaxID=2830843 RepID=UPI001C596D3B|nr:hypothetical protein [Austwickia sp. TVS 96-490-7B]